jgi:hypothetical protein
MLTPVDHPAHCGISLNALLHQASMQQHTHQAPTLLVTVLLLLLLLLLLCRAPLSASTAWRLA